MRNKKKIKVNLKTITPLWTGDAWGNNKEIRPSSIMGSLRFWFEVICYFAKVTNNSNYADGKLKDEVNGKEFREKILSNGNDFGGIDKTLAELSISLPSRIFGCTGWKGWVRIKKVSKKSENHNYKYYSGRLRLEDLKYEKNGKTIIPTWYFEKGFDGSFEVVFEIEENILKPVFYPLLTFMEKYGFWGGKWNIGYGRLKVEKVEKKDGGEWKEINDWRSEGFQFSTFYKPKDKSTGEKLDKHIDKKFNEVIEENNLLRTSSKPFEFIKYFLNTNSFYCNSERDFESKTSNIPKGLKITKFNLNTNEPPQIIRKLLKKKAEIRNCLRPNSFAKNKGKWDDFRHELLGTTSNGTQGTKIIPWIYKKDGQLKGGFVSIAGILRLGD